MEKQREMDNVIRTIYEYVAEDDQKRRKRSSGASGTLIVLCGDHGMNEAGNHGGSSDYETSTVSSPMLHLLCMLWLIFANRPWFS